MDNADTIIPNGCMVVKDGLIDYLGQSSPDLASCIDAEVINMTDKVIMPGFFNSHTHIAMVPFRGIVHDQENVLYDIIWPMETSFAAEDCYHLSRLGAIEALKAGITCVCDHYFFMDAIADGISSIGIRGVVGETIMDQGGPFSTPDSLEKGILFWERWHSRNPLITPVLAPHGPDTVTQDTLRQVKAFCEEHDTYYHMHVAQTRHEVDIIRSRHQTSSIQYLNNNDLLGPRLSAAHCIYTDNEDIRVLKDGGSHVLYCPSTHGFTGDIAPVDEMLALGINVCLGTDYVAENDDHNMMEEMRLATMLQKVRYHDPSALPTESVLRMATVNGPSAFGLGSKLGSLEVGKEADLIAINLCNPRLTPHYNIKNTIVYAASEGDIDHVMVAGKFLIRDKKTVGISEAEIIREGQAACDRIVRRALVKNPRLARAINPHQLRKIKEEY